MNNSHKILICPLEWGLGHAARMIPLASRLQEMNNQVFIGSGEKHLSLFRNELPGLSYIKFPGFKPRYSRFLPQYLILLFETPLLAYHIVREHYRLKNIIKKNDIDIVISDNRFGLWNSKIKSVYVTHMPLIPLPEPLRFLEPAGILLHRIIIKKYSLCLIPDLPGELNVSGRLSHGIKLPENVRYIGVLSRFSVSGNVLHTDPSFLHNTVILSGPEPQRGILKKLLVSILKDQLPKTVMLEGKPDKENNITVRENILHYNHLPTPMMKDMITGSGSIIARSGYTTIMELISLKCSALLIPTPGQTEQEYLAGYLAEKGWFSSVSQRDMRKGISLPSCNATWTDEIIEQSAVLLAKVLEELLKETHYQA